MRFSRNSELKAKIKRSWVSAKMPHRKLASLSAFSMCFRKFLVSSLRDFPDGLLLKAKTCIDAKKVSVVNFTIGSVELVSHFLELSVIQLRFLASRSENVLLLINGHDYGAF